MANPTIYRFQGISFRQPYSHLLRTWIGLVLVTTSLYLNSHALLADQIEMQNGDRYAGNVLSMNSNAIVLQSEVLGTINLPRAQVASINLGVAKTRPARTAATTNSPARTSPGTPASDLDRALRQLGTNSSLAQQVQSQFLATAGPEANNKFNEMLSSLANGSMSMGDLRVQAKSAADQLRTYKRELGGEAGMALDNYLGILDSFLKETGSNPVLRTNAPGSTPKRESASGRNDLLGD